MASISFQSSGNARTHFCGRNASAVPMFYSSMSTAIVTFKSEGFNDNSRVNFTYQIAGEPWNFIFYTEHLPSVQLLLEWTPVGKLRLVNLSHTHLR